MPPASGRGRPDVFHRNHTAPMLDVLIGVGLVVGYLVLQVWVLPRMGVPT